jgi:single-stranded DNA-specific DHH superfamily exonuclease
MASEPRTTISISTQLNLRRLEMQLESEELIHKRNLSVHEINRIRKERELNEEMDEEKKMEKKRAKNREKESKKEMKKIEKENKKIEKEIRKLENERGKEMGKTWGNKPRVSFCWAV